MSRTDGARFLDRTSPPHIATLILLSMLSALTLNMFLPSLPAMAEYFGTDYHFMQLSVAIYFAVNAVLQIIIGPLSDRFGRRPVMLASIAIFVVATIGCVLATHIATFMVFRMMQAAIVSGMALSRASVRDVLGASDAASRIGYVTMGMAIGPMVAPAFGGFLEQIWGWQATFVVLTVLGILSFVLAYSDMGETHHDRSATMSAQLREYPELLSARRFWSYALAAAFSAGAFFAYLGGAPYVGTVIYGLSPELLGIFFGAPSVGYLVGNGLAGRYSSRVGINRMIIAGGLIATAAILVMLLIFLGGQGSALVFFGSMTFVGLGNGLLIPNATSGFMGVRPHLTGSASGLGGAVMIGGGAVLSGTAGSILTPGTGADPLLWMMLTSSVLSVLCGAYTIRRERQITG